MSGRGGRSTAAAECDTVWRLYAGERERWSVRTAAMSEGSAVGREARVVRLRRCGDSVVVMTGGAGCELVCIAGVRVSVRPGVLLRARDGTEPRLNAGKHREPKATEIRAHVLGMSVPRMRARSGQKDLLARANIGCFRPGRTNGRPQQPKTTSDKAEGKWPALSARFICPLYLPVCVCGTCSRPPPFGNQGAQQSNIASSRGSRQLGKGERAGGGRQGRATRRCVAVEDEVGQHTSQMPRCYSEARLITTRCKAPMVPAT
jgi:hypothetical protein